LILSSPYVRARQTADIAGELLKVKVEESRQLLPSVEPHLIWDELREHADTAQIMLVGHEPHMSHLVSFLLMTALTVDFKKGALIRVEVENPPAQPHGVLKWMLTTRLAGVK
jgi:phosphohistidine phosphatase